MPVAETGVRSIVPRHSPIPGPVPGSTEGGREGEREGRERGREREREGERDQVKNAPGLIIYIHKVSTKVWV